MEPRTRTRAALSHIIFPMTPEQDIKYMQMALAEAQRAAELGEVPIGAVVVYDPVDPATRKHVLDEPQVLALAGNRRETDEDPAGHAEFIALHKASVRLGRWRLSGCTVYVTLEPCLMCAGLMHQARIDRCVYGAPDEKAGALGTLYNISTDERLNHRFEVVSGVMEQECREQLRSFFAALRERRKQAGRKQDKQIALKELPDPPVSVVVPVYNSSETLARCIKSIQQQSYRNFEVVAVDDGSHDNSLELLRSFAREDPRIKVFHKENGGVSSARNFALERAQGEWIAFADSDDWLAPDALRLLVDAAKDGADMAIADFYRVRSGRYNTKNQGSRGLIPFREFIRRMTNQPANFYYGSLWNKLFKRNIIQDAGLRFRTDIDYGEDHMLILEYLKHVENVGVVDRPVYYYLDRPGSLLHQGLNPVDIVKNKAGLIDAYTELCEMAGLTDNLFDSAMVAGFLVTPAMDGSVSVLDKKLDPSQIPS